MLKTLTLILAAMLSACGRDSEGSSLDQRIEAAKQQIGRDTCFQTQAPSQCEWDDFSIGPDSFNMAKRSDASILVMDPDFTVAANPFLLRYRNRILGYYEFDETHDEFAPMTLVARLPRLLGQVEVSFAGPEFIPASALTEVAKAAGKTYASLNLTSLPGHGAIVLGHLVDLVPEQPLVVVKMNTREIPAELCSSLNADSIDRVKARIASRAASLRALMARHNVRYVNASFGSTTKTMANDWSAVCHSTPPGTEQLRSLLSMLEPIYETLFNTPGVIAAQASAELGDPSDFPFDQRTERLANRVRVGHFSSTASGLDGDGRGSLVKTEQFPANGADVFLNWGCGGYKESCGEPHYRVVGGFGLSEATDPIMTTSFITPLAVARLVNLKNVRHPQEPWSNELVAQLQSDLTPPKCGTGKEACVYQDPIANRQLEVYRLNYK